MLAPGTIPTQEPRLRVGIILPEDRYTSLVLIVPNAEHYQVNYSGRTLLPQADSEIYFKNRAGDILFTLNGQEYSAPNEIKIFPVNESVVPEPGSGVKVKNVISGRDFHWKKYIDVNYAGTLILRKADDRIILINELPMEQYLMCVATSEMGAASPQALIEAQTITARSWMLANVEQKHVDLGMDVCNDDCCQRYQGTTFLSEQSVKGALSTSGKVLLYDNQICDARYSKSCGGVMESFENIWSGKALPYLQIKADAEKEPAEWHKPLTNEENFEQWINSVPDTFCSPRTIPETDLKQYLGSVDEQGHYFRWEEQISSTDLIQNLKRFHPVNPTKINAIRVISRGGSGRAIQAIVDYTDVSGSDKELLLSNEFIIRQSLHKKFLYSSAFTVEKVAEDSFKLKGAGWGHGVGLCQIGALGMSLKGYDAEKIVLHYFPGSSLKKKY